MKVLISGGTGYVGKFLIEGLSRKVCKFLNI